MDFTIPTRDAASPSRNVTPVSSSQPQACFTTPQSIPLDQDPRELKWRNYSESELEAAILTEKADVPYNEAISLLIKLGLDENLATDCHGSFDLLSTIPKKCMKHLTYPTENIGTFPDLQSLEESSLCSLVSSVPEARPNLSQANATRVLLANEMHVCEVTGTKPVPGVMTDLIDVIKSITPNPVVSYNEPHAPEKEENLAKPVQSDRTEVQNPGMESRPDEEVNIELLYKLMHRIYDLQIKVKERREWAQEKALQAAKKTSNDFLELRTLHMKREIEERMKKENEAKEDQIAKMMAYWEEEIKRTEGNAERAQMEVRRLEKENREMRAEIEAARLERSETDNKCRRLEKRLKRINKSADISERQVVVLQGEVEEAKKDNAEIEEQIEVVRKEISASEVKLQEEKKLKEQAVKLVDAECKTTISVKNSTRTRLMILTRKLDLDRRRHSEQVKVLEREISRLKKATYSSSAHSKLAEPCWPCIFCKAAEASVVFLPCAHQVLCVECGKDQDDIGSEKCPCCRVKVEERIFVYGLGA